MTLLMEIFYDFTCQDLPPAIEDAHTEFFGPPEGYFHKFLAWNPAGLAVDVSLNVLLLMISQFPIA